MLLLMSKTSRKVRPYVVDVYLYVCWSIICLAKDIHIIYVDITTNFPLTINPRISYIHYYTLVVSLTARMPDLQTSQRLSLISTLSGDLDSGGTGPKQSRKNG